MENVLGSGYGGDIDDAALVARAQQGESEALEALIERHQGWIYNIALRMVGSPEDAEDVAQEILLKLITRLSTFQGTSGLRTWLYRIVVNHVLTMRRRPWERMFRSFERQADLMDGLDLEAEPARVGSTVEQSYLAAETRAGCMTGMLLCLDRTQRVALVLGTLGVDSDLGADLLETSPENYRQILSRARKQLSSFMNDRCGLLNDSNPCRCARKTRAAIRAGLVDPGRLRFNLPYLHRIQDFVAHTAPRVESALETRLQDLLRGQPLYDPPDLKRLLAVMLRRGDVGRIVEFT